MSIVIAALYPDLLGTYGDGGNVITLRHRAALRGLETDVITVQPGDSVPEQADIYVLGGGEDTVHSSVLPSHGSLPALSPLRHVLITLMMKVMTEAAGFLHGVFEYLLRFGGEFDAVGVEGDGGA